MLNSDGGKSLSKCNGGAAAMVACVADDNQLLAGMLAWINEASGQESRFFRYSIAQVYCRLCHSHTAAVFLQTG